MEITSQKITTNELLEILNEYFNINANKLSNTFIEQCNEMVKKLDNHTKEQLIINYLLTFGIKSLDSILHKLRTSIIVKIKNEKMAYLYYLCIKDISFSDKEYTVVILKTKYLKKDFQIEEFFNVIATMFLYTTEKTSKSFSIDKIDNILSDNKIAKNVRNSVTTRLTNRKDDNYFRNHPKTDTEIVQIDKLGKYLHLNNKHTYIECPICGNSIKITNMNIKKIIDFDKRNGKVQITCNHEHTLYLKELPFSIYINKFLKDSSKMVHIPMFVLNNYNMLVNKFKIHPNTRKAKKSSKLLRIHELRNYLDFKNKYIFLDYPFITNNESKIKVTESNLNKIFEVNKHERKIYINVLKHINGSNNYQKVGFIYLNDIDINNKNDTLSTDQNIALTIVHNYKLLQLKNLIHKIEV